MDTFIFIAFCLFAFMVGMRISQRIAARRKPEADIHINKNQRSKMAHAEEPPEVRSRRLRRERRIRIFTIIQVFVLGGLMIYMVPALVRDFMLPGQVDVVNIILRCLIFILTIYIFILGYIKVFGRKGKEEQGDK